MILHLVPPPPPPPNQPAQTTSIKNCPLLSKTVHFYPKLSTSIRKCPLLNKAVSFFPNCSLPSYLQFHLGNTVNFCRKCPLLTKFCPLLFSFSLLSIQYCPLPSVQKLISIGCYRPLQTCPLLSEGPTANQNMSPSVQLFTSIHLKLSTSNVRNALLFYISCFRPLLSIKIVHFFQSCPLLSIAGSASFCLKL